MSLVRATVDKTMAQNIELIGTAYHEAAHAVALHENGIVSDWVEVTTESTGSTECGKADFETMADKAIFVLALAGIHSESQVRPDTSVGEFAKIITGGSSDRHLVDSVFRKRWMATSWLSYHAAHNAAEAFVKRNWNQIDRVAKALLKKCESGFPARLTRPEVEQAIAG